MLISIVAVAPACAQAPCGDCHPDGAVDVVDAFLAAQAAAGMGAPLAPAAFARCNVHGPWGDPGAPGAAVDILDTLWIAQYVVGLRSELRCVTGPPVWDLREVPIDISPNEVWGSFPLDLDGDGCMDWVEIDGPAPGGNSGLVRLWRSRCDGTAEQTLVFDSLLVDGTFAATGDLDRDGDDDFVVVGLAAQPYPPLHYELITYLNNGQGVFSEAQRLNSPGWPTRVWIAEMDGDGLLDLVVQQGDASGQIYLDIHFGDAQGRVSSPVTIPTYVPALGFRLVSQIVDLDQDGRADLLGMRRDYATAADNPAIFVDWNDGTGLGFQEQILPEQPPEVAMAGGVGLVRDARAYDFDGDGILDIYSEWGLPTSTNLFAYSTRGLGGRAFVGLDLIGGELGSSQGRNCRGIADIDGDGYLDVALHLINGNIEFHSYTPTGWTGPVLVLPIGTQSADGLALDLDGDGDMDFIANTAPPARPTHIWMNHRF